MTDRRDGLLNARHPAAIDCTTGPWLGLATPLVGLLEPASGDEPSSADVAFRMPGAIVWRCVVCKCILCPEGILLRENGDRLVGRRTHQVNVIKPRDGLYLSTFFPCSSHHCSWDIFEASDDSSFPKSHKTIISCDGPGNSSILLHLLDTPTSRDDQVIGPTCTRDLTDYVIATTTTSTAKASLIHLHEDVWHKKMSIVKSRLLNRLKPSSVTRLFGRKTVARRLDAETAIRFLESNHLWSATKARYYYGLHDRDGLLVAVATFSSKRNVQAGKHQRRRSFELIRFCNAMNVAVVGGISKLIRAFINDQTKQVDYIATVVDRDWGAGDGWHSIGFETLHVMSPVAMAVKDGTRRHLVGAGTERAGSKLGRPGVDENVLAKLAGITSHREAFECLEEHGYYSVFDAGVERLLWDVSSSQQSGQLSNVASYGASYQTTNMGVSAMMRHIVALSAKSRYGGGVRMPEISRVNASDSPKAQQYTATWENTCARTASLLFSTPSSLDEEATVEIRERQGTGWCTVGIVGGATKSIYHGTYKLSDEGVIDSRALTHEYMRSMASVFFAAHEFQRGHKDSVEEGRSNHLSFLHLGYGSGSLPRFMAHSVSAKGVHCRNVAVELDTGVVKAAQECNLDDGIESVVDDALAYCQTSEEVFDAVFVDVFDGRNLTPEGFYSSEFVESVSKHAMVIHNLHTGGKIRSRILYDTIDSYRRVFKTVFVVEALGSRHTGGNAIVLAMNKRRLDATSEALSWREAGEKAQSHWDIDFDITARISNKLWLS